MSSNSNNIISLPLVLWGLSVTDTEGTNVIVGMDPINSQHINKAVYHIYITLSMNGWSGLADNMISYQILIRNS